MHLTPKQKNPGFQVTPIAAAVTAAVCLTFATTLPVNQAYAASEDSAAQGNVFDVSIAPGPLSQTLGQFAAQTGAALSFDATAAIFSQQSSGISGTYSVAQGFNKLLKGTGITLIRTGNNSFILQMPEQNKAMQLDKVKVTGTPSRFGDAPAEPGGFKAEYQTTATKMAMPLKETPQAVSVITPDLLEARQVKDLSTAVETSASVSNSANGDGTQTGPGMFGGLGKYPQKFVLRGQPVIVRSDGFKVGSNNIDLAAYERIEVVKGPSGFYGQGSLGGFINMVRKKPQHDFAASVSIETGSFDTYRTEADVTGSLNEEQNLRGRLNLVYEDADSFVEKLESKRIVFAPSLETIISDKTRLLAQFLYQKERFDSNPGVPLQTLDNESKVFDILSDPTKLYGVRGDKSETEVIDLLLRVDHEVSDKWLLSLLLQKNKSSKDIIQPNYLSAYGGYFYIYGNKDSWERDYWASELRIQGEYDAFGETHTLLLGAEHNEQFNPRDWGFASAYEYSTYADFTPDFSRYRSFSPDEIPIVTARDIKTRNRSIYAQTVLSLSDKTKLLIGGRFDDVYETVNRRDNRPSNNTPTDESAFTGKVGLSHAINSNITTYGVFAESFEPSWGESEDGLLPPITGTGYELGFKTEWLENKLGANLSFYRQDLTNSPITDPDNTDFQIAAGEHRTEGMELEISGSPYPGWRLAAAYTWMDNEFIEADDPYYGLSIDGSVDQQLGLYAQYEFQQGPLRGLGIGATYLHVGERHFVNTDIADYAQVDLEGYDRLDLNFSYKGVPDWDINLLVRNVTDETYIESAASRWAGNFFGSPRAMLLTAKYNF